MISRQNSTHITNHELAEQEHIFNESDAIMRPDILDQLSIYYNKGGNIESIAGVLVRHYRGIPNMIGVILKILSDIVGQDSQDTIKRQIRNTMFELFNVEKMDNLLLKGKMPKEFKVMFHDPFWIDTIISLSEKPDTKSLFISYCMNKICKLHPEKIMTLPPFYVSYSSYKNIISHILNEMKTNSDQKQLDRLIRIISTDDLTLAHSALIFHNLSQSSLIQLGNSLKDGKKALFNKISFHLNSANDNQLTNMILAPSKLRLSDFQYISGQTEISTHLRSLIEQKICELLKDRNNSIDLVHAAIDTLIKVSGATVKPDDKHYFYSAFENIHKTNYKLYESLGSILYAVGFPCFCDVLTEIAVRQLKFSFQSPDETGKSAQAQILEEAAFKFPRKIPKIVADLADVFVTNEARNAEEALTTEIFSIFLYLVRLGYAKTVLRCYSEMMTPKISKNPHLHRAFLMKLIQLRFPNDFSLKPVRNFIEAMSFLFDNEIILVKIVPKSAANILSTQKKNIPEIARFLDRIPFDIDIPDRAKQILDSVRDDIQRLNI